MSPSKKSSTASPLIERINCHRYKYIYLSLNHHKEIVFIAKYIDPCIVLQKSIITIQTSQTIVGMTLVVETEIDQRKLSSEYYGQLHQRPGPTTNFLIMIFSPSQVHNNSTPPSAIPTPNKLLPLFIPHLHPGLICLASIPNLPVLPLLFLVPGHKPTGLGVKPGARELFNGIYALATGDSCRRRTATLGTQWISMSYSSNDICMQSAIY